MDNRFPRSPFSPPQGSMPFAGIATFAGYPLWQPDHKIDAVVLGIPYDEGTTYRPGARFGPRAIREASMFYSYDEQKDRYFDADRRKWILSGKTVADAGDVEIEPLGDNTASYSFALPNGDILFALWTNDVAADHDPGDSMELTFHDLSAERVVGIDVLHGFEQELEYEIFFDGNLVIPDLMVKDYPIIIKFVNATP